MTDLGASLQKDVDHHRSPRHAMKVALLRHCLDIPDGWPFPLLQHIEESLDAVKASSLSLCRMLSLSIHAHQQIHEHLFKCRLPDLSPILLYQCPFFLGSFRPSPAWGEQHKIETKGKPLLAETWSNLSGLLRHSSGNSLLISTEKPKPLPSLLYNIIFWCDRFCLLFMVVGVDACSTKHGWGSRGSSIGLSEILRLGWQRHTATRNKLNCNVPHIPPVGSSLIHAYIGDLQH